MTAQPGHGTRRLPEPHETQTCARCKSAMVVSNLTRNRRRIEGPGGWEYGVYWQCSCGRTCWTRTTRVNWLALGGKIK